MEDGTTGLFRRDLAPQLLHAGGLDPVRLVSESPRVQVLEGRTSHPVITLPGTDVQIVVKSYRRGGWFGRLLPDVYWTAERFRRELEVYELLRKGGVGTLEVLGLVTRRRIVGVEAWLLTRWIQDALPLDEYLLAGGSGPERARLARAVGITVRALHDLGVDHPDLNLKNILFRRDGSGIVVLVIDLDRSRSAGTLEDRSRWRNLLRFHRSAVKWTHRFPDSAVTSRDLLRFALGYFGRDRRAIEGMSKRVAAYRVWENLHRVFWPRRGGAR